MGGMGSITREDPDLPTCCPGNTPEVGIDEVSGATIIECTGCGIMIGAYNGTKARTLWIDAIGAACPDCHPCGSYYSCPHIMSCDNKSAHTHGKL